MANRTVRDAKSVRGTNPQYLVEKIIRSRIYDCSYWKEECFALTAELLVDKAMALDHIGGTFGGNIKPTPFLCLMLKMLQIQPEKDIVVEFIRNEDYKYARALGAFYMRLVGTSLECYKYLEPLYNDYRKLKRKSTDGAFALLHMDEFIDELLREERVCDIILPRIQKRHVLEETEQLEARKSALEDDLDDLESDDEVDVRNSPPRHRSRSRSQEKRRRKSRTPERRRRSRSRSHSPQRRRRSSRSPRRHRHRSRSRSHSPRSRRRHRHRPRSRSRSHSRSRSRSPKRRGR